MQPQHERTHGEKRAGLAMCLKSTGRSVKLATHIGSRARHVPGGADEAVCEVLGWGNLFATPKAAR